MTTTVRPDRRPQVGEQPDQSLLAGLVQTGQRLVEDQDLRLAGQDAGQGHPALLAAAELVDAPLADLGDVEADRRQRRARPRRHRQLRRLADRRRPWPAAAAAGRAGRPARPIPPGR